MVYKKYIKRGGKVFGPYYYESYREGDKVKTRFVSGPKKRDIMMRNVGGKHFVTLFIGLVVVGFLVGMVFLNDGEMRMTGYGIEEGFFILDNPPSQSWNVSYNSGNTDEARGIAVDNSGGVYVTGYNTGANTNYFTIKYNSTGGHVWNVSYITLGSDTARGIAVDNQGFVYVTGDALNQNYYTIKYNAINGGEVWNVSYDSGNNDVAYGIAVDNSSNVYVTGFTTATSSDYYTIKYNSTGGQVWNVSYDSGATDVAYGVAVDNNKSVYVTGSKNNGVDTDYFTIKYNSTGGHVWNVSYDSGATDVAYGITLDSLSNVYVVGDKSEDYFIIKYNSTGSQIWNVTYNDGGYDYAIDVAVDSNMNVYVTGNVVEAGNQKKYNTIKYNSTGSQIWNTSYNGSGSDLAYGIAVDNSNNVYVTGTYNISGTQDYFTIKYLNISAPDTTPPTFTGINNVSIYSNQSVFADFNATDETGFDSFKINWTSTFAITRDGNLTNTSGLNINIYYINVTINDSSNNTNSRVIWVNVSNATILDITPPTISLISPADATSSTTSAYNFTFNVSDASNVSNCSLIVDGSIINILTSVSKTSENGMYNSSFSVATHTWNINCTDSANNKGNSSVRSFTVTSGGGSSSSSGGGGSSSSSSGGAVTPPAEEKKEEKVETTPTTDEKPKEEIIEKLKEELELNKTIPKEFVCGEWEECESAYTLNSLSESEVRFIGVKKRTCTDGKTETTERQECTLKKEINIEKTKETVEVYDEKTGETTTASADKIQVYDKETQKPVLKLTIVKGLPGKPNKLDVEVG